MPPEKARVLPFYLSDIVVTTMATLAAAYLLVVAPWVPGSGTAIGVFVVIALGPVVLRTLGRRWPAFDVAATFWLVPAVAVAHGHLGPIADAIRPELMDRYLAAGDLRLFGAHPSLALERVTPHWLTELLLYCYYTYFLWPAVLCALLYWKRGRIVVHEYALAMSLLYAANFVLYLFVPAIGPRFYLAGEFKAPLEGLYLTPLLDSMMRGPPFIRDCFPSGHTATTLLVLSYAYVHLRRFFWAMLPVGMGIIAATLVCRFHYGVDLLFALPLLLVCRSAAASMARARPRGVVVAVPAFRAPARA